MGLELTDMFMTLKPRSHWKRANDQADLTVLVENHLCATCRASDWPFSNPSKCG